MLERLKKKMGQSPLLTRLLLWIVLPLMIGAALLLARMKDSLPPPGAIRLSAGVSAAVTISRDEHGVPHIEASTDDDAFYAIGYVHAQDRLWQMEVQRRIAQGRMSEVFGRDAVPRDIWFRTLGLYEAAKSSWPALSQPAQASLTAYTAGVNAGMRAQAALPAEFVLLGVNPEPWTVYDSLAWIKVFALNLGGNFSGEMGRYLASQHLDAKQMMLLFPDNASAAPTTVAQGPQPAQSPQLQQQQAMARMLAFQQTELMHGLGLGARGVGSNAWVVAGKHHAKGAAMLANDPHLNLQMPSLWYVLSAKGKTLNVAGMSMAGLPLVIFGHTDKIAWGGTNMMADVQDLYFEHVDPAQPARYESKNQWEAFTTRSESIAVRADFPEFLHKKFQPVAVQIRSSRHGPIVSDMFKAFDQPVALRWTALEPGDTSYEAFFRLNYATDWNSFTQALGVHVAPAMNMVYADTQGNIGYMGAGRIPLRKKGDGTMPTPGWNEDFGWQGYIPAEQLPRSYNPAAGYIVTANNRITGDNYPHHISSDWASPARARRIEQLLQQKLSGNKQITLEDMQQMQGDNIDLEAQEILPQLLKLVPKNDDQRQALSWLKDWHGEMGPDSQAATIFNVWMRHLRQKMFAAQFKGYWNQAELNRIVDSFSEQIRVDGLNRVLQQKQTGWCAAFKSDKLAACDDLLHDSLQAALDEVLDLKGDHSMKSWQWGKLQKSLYLHTPFSQIKPLDSFFERRTGKGGSENTINVAQSNYEPKKGYFQYLGAGFRQVTLLERDAVLASYMNSTGQSGNVLSGHYDDMVEPFAQVQFFRLDAAAKTGGAK